MLFRSIAIGLFILLVAVVAVLHFVPLDVTSFEKAAEERFGVPVKIASIHVTLVPSPRLRMENIVIGEDNKIEIASAVGIPELGSILDKKKAFTRIELQDVKLPQQLLGATLWGKHSDSTLRIDKLIAKNIKLSIEGITTPPLDGEASFAKDTGLEKAQLVNSEKTFTVNISEPDRKSTRLNSSHSQQSRMPSSA